MSGLPHTDVAMSQPAADLADRITTLSAHINAAKAELIALVAEFDACLGWAEEGCQSCAHWLNWKCGVSSVAAREQVRVARALGDLPAIADAFARGVISYSKVCAMTRVATPANEDYLLMLAEHGTAAHLERVVRGVRRDRAERALEEENARHEARELHWASEDDGMLSLRARLDAEAGARFVAAMERETERVRREHAARVSAEAPDDGPRPPAPFAAHRADALLRLVAGNNPDTEIVVHVAGDSLVGDSAETRCELEDGPSLPGETARRLACDAGVVRITEDAEGEPLYVGRRTRSIPPALRRALEARDGGCRFPGCDAVARVEGHHLRHWARGGETAMHNLVSLCRHHHRLVHEGGFDVEHRGHGTFRFRRPDGQVIADTPPRHACGDAPAAGLAARNDSRGVHIDETTGVTLWDGLGMDEAMAVEGVLAAGGELR